ncbi:CHASE3 domain-containing protein [Sphingobium sp. H39-3-25]|uniref:CHASE3 domain-containing protein n=1 Tax=Sphingobium arseniciresistens TaxID=3030834 RepID=UPI0023B8CC67|nr:CHASE3 domain-containing protein [Sphingobium arseniciresistens]
MPSVRPDRSLIALLLGFVILVVVVAATISLYTSQQRSQEWVSHTLRVESQLSTILSRMQDAETGQRGFMLTGDPEFLKPYRATIAHMAQDLDTLTQLTDDNPAQSAAVVELRSRINRRMAALDIGIERKRLGDEISPEGFRPGLALMDDIRQLISQMKERERKLLEARTQNARQLTTWVSGALAISAMLVIMFGLAALLNVRRRLADSVTTGDALAHSNQRLRAEAEERQIAEAQLRQIQKMETIGHLTGGIAHDFNNMLAIVIGSLDMAKRRLSPDAESRALQSLDHAMDGAQRAAQLTARLLAFSRQQPLAPQPLEANKLVGGMSEMLRRTIGDQLRMETVLAGGLWPCFADPGQLENAIVNLCVNARDAMPEGGRLTIETTNAFLDEAYAAAHEEVVPGQYVMISVSDTGTGMPKEVAQRAFDPFFTTKALGQGTGLGLSQVFGFIKQSHGHVKIYSEAGEGTTIKLYLPRHYGAAAEDGRSAAAIQTSNEALPRAIQEEIILVVEDEERVRHVSVDALRDLGYVVVQASDARHALEVLAVHPRIDLLFTDIVMPDMNGRKLADLARIDRPELKVLYTTGYTRNAIVHNGMLDPGVAFLAKPFTLSQLANKVRQVLDAPHEVVIQA